MTGFSVEVFEQAARGEDVRYWYAHEFMRSLGYESWPSFQGVITKAMGSCTKLNIDPTEAFTPEAVHMDGREIRTYRMTRFACFLVSMHADSKKVEVAKAKAVLAAIADQLVEEHISENDIGRLETRDDLKVAERAMSSVAKGAGLEDVHFGLFKDAGFRGMYNMSIRQLVERKGAPQNKTLYDFMGLEELAGNLFRVTQTTVRIRSQKVEGTAHLIDTAKNVGAEVRQIMIRNSGGIAPEALPISQDISVVKSRLKSANRRMRKLDTQKRLSSGKKGSPSGAN
jgi:DNA-damage-inducible protein D